MDRLVEVRRRTPSARPSAASAVSPAPETSNTSRGAGPEMARRPAAHERSDMPWAARVTRIALRRASGERRGQGRLDLRVGARRQVRGARQLGGVGLDHVDRAVAGEVAAPSESTISDRASAPRRGRRRSPARRRPPCRSRKAGSAPAPSQACVTAVASEPAVARSIGSDSSESTRSSCWPAGDEAGLCGGAPAGPRDEMALDAGLRADEAQRLVPGRVVADQPDQRGRPAERGDVARHVARAAEHDVLGLAREHRESAPRARCAPPRPRRSGRPSGRPRRRPAPLKGAREGPEAKRGP